MALEQRYQSTLWNARSEDVSKILSELRKIREESSVRQEAL